MFVPFSLQLTDKDSKAARYTVVALVGLDNLYDETNLTHEARPDYGPLYLKDPANLGGGGAGTSSTDVRVKIEAP